jgi:hypothetical protein
MAHDRNKYQSRENRAKIREILMHEWDPIGVRDAPEAQDEYDAYVGRVYVMLVDEARHARQSPRTFSISRRATWRSPISPVLQRGAIKLQRLWLACARSSSSTDRRAEKVQCRGS